LALDFSSLAKPYIVTVPIYEKSFLLNKKRYSVDCEDGFWEIQIENNKATAITPSIPKIPKEAIAHGYTYNSDLVFSNFDVAKRKWNFSLTKEIRFLNTETFTAVKVVVWEDKQLYYLEPWYEDFKTYEVKNSFDSGQDLNLLKGVTPELRTLHLFHSLEREQVQALLKEQTEKEDQERLKQDLGYRLYHTFKLSGAEILNYSKSGNRIIVDWKLIDGGYKYNSVLDAETFRCLQAGYCMSGDDERHSATSMIQLASDYEDRDLTYRTRV